MSPEDASVIGTAAPVATGRYVGESGSWMKRHFPDGMEVNFGPLLVSSAGLVIFISILAILSLLGTKLAPKQLEAAKADLGAALEDARNFLQTEEDREGDEEAEGREKTIREIARTVPIYGRIFDFLT